MIRILLPCVRMLGSLSGGGSMRGCRGCRRARRASLPTLAISWHKANETLVMICPDCHVPDLQKECEVVKLDWGGGRSERESAIVDAGMLASEPMATTRTLGIVLRYLCINIERRHGLKIHSRF